MDKITVNGQTYDSWEELPPEIKQVLAATLPDADHNGVPDVFEGKGAPPTSPIAKTTTKITVNGTEYTGQLPAVLRNQLRAALGSVIAGVENNTAAQSTPPPTPGAPAPGTPTPGTPAPGQIVLNGQTVSADAPQQKKGFFKRLFGG